MPTSEPGRIASHRQSILDRLVKGCSEGKGLEQE